ncbi:MAG: hypothetical protein ACKOC5_10765 [Chloroflexota bacterium]
MQLPAEFRPESFSRRGEATAWGMAILAILTWVFLAARGQPVPLAIRFVAGFTLLAGAAISLTNWSDRRTVLRLSESGIAYANGLRSVQLPWEQILQVRVYPSNLGDQVRVVGKQTFFTFRTYGEARLGEQVRGRMGFAAGEQILNQVRRSAGLNHIERSGPAYIYTRD